MKDRNILSNYWSIVLLVISVPFISYFIILIWPTFDDWTSMTSPSFEPFFMKERFMFYGYHWRPFDTIIGYIAGLNTQLLYPAFNHCLVILGHFINALLIYRLTVLLGFTRLTSNIVTTVFFFLPATMATVLAVDSQNQTFAFTFDLLAFLCYVRRRYIGWILLIFLAAWSKENGLMWALICPILAYGFDYIHRKTLYKHLIIGMGIMAIYALAYVLMPREVVVYDEYVPTVTKVVLSITKFVFTAFVTVDYVYLLHQPSHNLLLACLTLLLTLPFVYLVFIRQLSMFFSRRVACILLSMLIAASPHLFTVFSMMHTYGLLVFVILLMAISLSRYKINVKPVIISFLLFMLSAVTIDVHLWYCSFQSGEIGRQMAQDAVNKTHKPIEKAYTIIIDDDYTKLSSFCVVPCEAFGWGRAVQLETNYVWPTAFEDTTIARTPDAVEKARQIAQKVLNESIADGVWIVNKTHIDVIEK